MGSRGCARCGAVLSLDRTNGVGESTPTVDYESPPVKVSCRVCGADLDPSLHFCGACGSRSDDAATPSRVEAVGSAKAGAAKKTLFFGAMQAARAKLVLIKGDGHDGVSFTLAGDEHVAGREDAALLFEEDPFLSPRHANFFYRSGELVVKDESSINGVFIRIRGTRKLEPGDRFLVGEQVIEVQTSAVDGESRPDPEGTYFYSSPRRGAAFRLVQVLRGGESGLAYCPSGDIVSLGREDNDINFPDDPFISGHHAQISFSEGTVSLTDLGSKNGTFVKVNEESKLEHGDYVFMGQQLLRIEIV